MTLDELDYSLPNGFHDAELFSFEIDYFRQTATFHLHLLVGGPDEPVPERDAYQEATLVVSGLCFCSIDPPYSTYPFLPDGKPILVTGNKPTTDVPPFVPDLVATFPAGVWCYLFFVHDWNASINIAGRDASVTWIGEKPKHAV